MRGWRYYYPLSAVLAAALSACANGELSSDSDDGGDHHDAALPPPKADAGSASDGDLPRPTPTADAGSARDGGEPPPPTPIDGGGGDSDDPCMGLDYLGECDGTVARWCSREGRIEEVDCTRWGLDCGWIDEETGYYCTDSPGDPPSSDAGTGGSDAGAGGTDSGIDPDPPPPAGDVEWIDWPEQHSASDSSWGPVLTDIVRHLPESYGDTYYSDDKVTYGHETTHGINSHVRNYLAPDPVGMNGFYCLDDRAAAVEEPDIRKSDVNSYVPTSLHGPRYELYLEGSSSWDDRPLYLWDEWVAYVNGGAVGVDRVERGLWTSGWRDAVMGPLEFTVYGLAVGMAVEDLDPSYFTSNDQFRALMKWLAERAMEVFEQGRTMPEFEWDRQEDYYRAMRESSDASEFREFVRRTYGDAWATEVMGF